MASLHAVSQALMVNQLFKKRLSLPLSWCSASQVQVRSPLPPVGCISQLNVVWLVENCGRESPITSIEEVWITHLELITRVLGERYLHPGLEICHLSLTLQRDWQCHGFSVLIRCGQGYQKCIFFSYCMSWGRRDMGCSPKQTTTMITVRL